MTDSIEVAITSELSGQLWSVGVWDIHTGSQLMAYKGGGVCGSHCLSLLGSDYLVAAEMTKPLLHVWPANRTETSHDLRTVCPGIIRALAVSPDGKYIVAGVAEKIHIWQVESGKLLAVAARHFQEVTCIRFNEDGTHFVSAGEDGMVLVWCLTHLVARDGMRLETVHSFSDHYLAVKDIFIGNGRSGSRITSVSVDGSCRIYDFASGALLLSLLIDSYILTSVTSDVLESSLFLGCDSGDILSISLREGSREQEHHVTDEEKSCAFTGHSKAVTSLSSSQDAITLLSGSADETVRLWHISSKQCLRIIHHKGPVANAFLSFIPSQMFAEKFKPSIVMHRLQRSIDAIENQDGIVEVLAHEHAECTSSDEHAETNPIQELLSYENSHSVVTEDASAATEEVENLRRKNLGLYKFAAEKILNGFPDMGSDYVIPNLVNIDLAVQEIHDNSINLMPEISKLSTKFKLNKKKLAKGKC